MVSATDDREQRPRQHVEHGRTEQQPDEQLAEDGRLSDPGGDRAGELCGGDDQRQQQQDLKEVGHGEMREQPQAACRVSAA